jgi:hypothetical protein
MADPWCRVRAAWCSPTFMTVLATRIERRESRLRVQGSERPVRRKWTRLGGN